MTDWVAQICESPLMPLPETATHGLPIFARYQASDCGKLRALANGHDAPTNIVPQASASSACGTPLARRCGSALPRQPLTALGMQPAAPRDLCRNQPGSTRRIPLRELRDAGGHLLRPPQCVLPNGGGRARSAASIGCRGAEHCSILVCRGNAGPTRQAVGYRRQPTALPSQRRTFTVSVCAVRAPRVDPALRAAWCWHRHASG